MKDGEEYRDRPAYRAVEATAENEARKSRLPGWTRGPADAFRHIVASAEMTRRYGGIVAHVAGEANEQKGNLFYRQPRSDLDMDRHNNSIGRRIGRTARDFDEVVAKAKEAITEGAAHDGDPPRNGKRREIPVWRPTADAHSRAAPQAR